MLIMFEKLHYWHLGISKIVRVCRLAYNLSETVMAETKNLESERKPLLQIEKQLFR